jgi:hypothetical protein
MKNEEEKPVSAITKFLRVTGNVIASLAHLNKTTVIDASTGKVEGHYSAEELARRQEASRPKWR